jgi:hypothetical protein
LTMGLKTCSPPLFYSGILHFNLLVITIIPKSISDISQKRAIRLLTLKLLPLIMVLTLSAVSGSTRIGLFVIKSNTQHHESMFASFRRVACLFMIYSSGICICMCTNGRRTGQSHISRRTTGLEMSLMFGSLVVV